MAGIGDAEQGRFRHYAWSWNVGSLAVSFGPEIHLFGVFLQKRKLVEPAPPSVKAIAFSVYGFHVVLVTSFVQLINTIRVAKILK